jgi:hypothetical protein
MTARWPLPFVLVFGLTITRAASPTVTIDTAAPSGKVSPLFYGLMTEEINHAYDGGLYAELVRNRGLQYFGLERRGGPRCPCDRSRRAAGDSASVREISQRLTSVLDDLLADALS